jgi:LPS export ABC transporter protein LptC
MRHRFPPPAARLLPAVLACGLLLLAGCGQQHRMLPQGTRGELPDQEVSDFALTETDTGTPQWKLYARYAATYSSRNTIVARGLRVDFYDESGQRSSELTAREGEINQVTRDMTARGSVVLQTTEGTRMSTEQLRFLNREQKIVSDQLVRVERAGDVLTGYGYESDPQLRHFEFKRQVEATVRTRTGGVLAPRGGKR